MKITWTRSGAARAVLVAVLLTPTTTAAQRAPRVPAPLRGLDAWVERSLSDWGVPGLAIAVVKDDSVVFARGFGVRRLGEPAPVTERTLFASGTQRRSAGTILRRRTCPASSSMTPTPRASSRSATC